MPPEDQEAWKRLGRLLAGRRVQIAPRYKNKNLFCRERGLNRRMLWRIEAGAGDKYLNDTLRAVEVAYMLVPGSLDRTLAGGELEVLPVPASPLPAPQPGRGTAPEDDVDAKFLAAAGSLLAQGSKPARTRLRELEGLLRGWPGSTENPVPARAEQS